MIWKRLKNGSLRFWPHELFATVGATDATDGRQMKDSLSARVADSAIPMHKRIRDNITVLFIRLLSVAAGLLYVKSYATKLPPVEVGVFFYLATVSYAVNALVFVPMDFYMQARLANLAELPSYALQRLIKLALAAAFIASLALGAPLVWSGNLRTFDLPLLYAAAALLYLCTTFRNLLNNRGDTIFVSAMLLAEVLGRLVAFLLAGALFQASARVLLLSSILALLVELTFIFVRLHSRLSFKSNQSRLDHRATIARVAMPIAGSAVCNTVQLQAFRVGYPLAGWSATSANYGVVANIGQQAMAACSSIFAQLETPRLYASGGQSIRRYTWLAVTLIGCVLVIMTPLSQLMVLWLAKAQYLPYAHAIIFGIVVEGCNLIIGGHAVALSLQRRTGLLLKFNLIAAIASISGGLIALRYYPNDPLAIGWAIAGSQILMVVALLTCSPNEPKN